MDVLDDLVGEANEVCELNPWLSYPMVLHRLREFGSSDKIFDLLDERPLSLAEARAGKESEIPNFKGSSLGRCGGGGPRADLGPQARAPTRSSTSAFSRALKGALACEPAVWCPLRKRLLPWINVRKLRKLRKRKPLLSHPALLRAQSSSAACVLS
ncbi:hypothetical protein JL721_7052 [Aureococcus anophagefferens]|nr:hypothetical protein JL721_7052 [Aureococcus anophagefferens]